MARVVAVHGAFNELWGPHSLTARWLPAVQDGLWHHGVTLAPEDFAVCFYGDLFRRNPARDVPEEIARTRAGAEELLAEASGGAAEALQQLFGKALYDRTVDLVAIMTSRADLSEAVHARMTAVVGPDTRVVVAHSLGSVVAYRTLLAHPEWNVHTLVTLGSPIGIPLLLDTYVPERRNGIGPWPGSVQRWVNVAAKGDIAAVVPRLADLFGDRVEDLVVDNGVRAHDPEPYLNAEVTGAAIAAALVAD